MNKKPNKKTVATNGKLDTLLRLSYAVFELEETQGHLAWKVTDLARKVKLSRSLIYSYLGSSKRAILLNSFRNFINEFYGFDNMISTSLRDQIGTARREMLKHPEAILFYQKWRSKKTWLQPEFVKIENQFQNKLKNQNPKLDHKQALSLHALIHGVVTAPFLTPEQAADIFDKLATSYLGGAID